MNHANFKENETSFCSVSYSAQVQEFQNYVIYKFKTWISNILKELSKKQKVINKENSFFQNDFTKTYMHLFRLRRNLLENLLNTFSTMEMVVIIRSGQYRNSSKSCVMNVKFRIIWLHIALEDHLRLISIETTMIFWVWRF